ncbi:hypothetical protein CC80DRAFT_541832 [Byssothecium circinans]|uniref:Uncharacterized protein n=1 Tax=Byssothecium circinans TaxID=147558 RepID=A0A6A5UFG2_9PLEO|nr:hypothetical protein CC80DRAFT_541832 [Byssothecium circinans]
MENTDALAEEASTKLSPDDGDTTPKQLEKHVVQSPCGPIPAVVHPEQECKRKREPEETKKYDAKRCRLAEEREKAEEEGENSTPAPLAPKESIHEESSNISNLNKDTIEGQTFSKSAKSQDKINYPNLPQDAKRIFTSTTTENGIITPPYNLPP